MERNPVKGGESQRNEGEKVDVPAAEKEPGRPLPGRKKGTKQKRRNRDLWGNPLRSKGDPTPGSSKRTTKRKRPRTHRGGYRGRSVQKESAGIKRRVGKSEGHRAGLWKHRRAGGSAPPPVREKSRENPTASKNKKNKKKKSAGTPRNSAEKGTQAPRPALKGAGWSSCRGSFRSPKTKEKKRGGPDAWGGSWMSQNHRVSGREEGARGGISLALSLARRKCFW